MTERILTGDARSRDRAIDPAHTALLLIDVQNGIFNQAERARRPYFHESASEVVIPNLQRLIAAARSARAEIIYTVIESLTLDGRDRSLDYKITGFNVAKDSWDGKVLDAIAPEDDEIVLPKTSSSVFISTHIDYVLRNLGVRQLVISGLVTDQCVESAIRDACDLGYLVTQVVDACLAYSEERHQSSLSAISGYCRQVTTDSLIREIQG